MKTFKKGKFTPRYPEKYRGDINNIVFRSSWELRAFEFLDGNPNILQWGSEIIVIPYIKPDEIQAVASGLKSKPKVSRYYPDLWVRLRTPSGEIVEDVIEIKPFSQTHRSTKKNAKTRLFENRVYELNKAKWIAAHKWCKSRGLNFRVLTDRSSFWDRKNNTPS